MLQNIEELEQTHRLCLDIIDKIKVLKLRIDEDKAYLASYDKTKWYLRPPAEYAEAKSLTVANREKTIAQLKEKYNKAMKEFSFIGNNNNLISTAETFYSNY